MDDLVMRVQRLESELKKVKRSKMIWLFLAGGMLLVAFQAPSTVPKVVEAQEFRLVGEQGQLRGHWGQSRADRLGTSLSIWDLRGGSEVVVIQSYEGGGEIALKGDENHGQVRLSAEDGGGQLELFRGRLIPGGEMGYFPMAKIDAVPNHGRIELFECQFEEPPEGGLTVGEEKTIFQAPAPK